MLEKAVKDSAGSKVFLITGSASGIGAATARLAVSQGHRVVVADINVRGAKAVAGELGDNAIAMKLDIRSSKQWEAALDQTYAHFGKLDVLVNNAAVVHTGKVQDVPLVLHEQTMLVNSIGPLIGMMAVLPRFRKARAGHIATVCSMTAFLPFPGIATYAASKHALRAIHFGVAMEERQEPISFTIIHPSSTETSDARARGARGNRACICCSILGAIRRCKNSLGGHSGEESRGLCAAVPWPYS